MPLYYISHFLQIWFLPPGVNLLLAFIGFLLLNHLHRLGECLIIFSFLSLWLFSTPIIAQFFISGLLHQYPALQIQPDKIDEQQVPGAIVVLGGGWTEVSEYKGKYVTNRLTLNRLRYGVSLHQQLHLPIIVSGGGLKGYSFTEAELMLNDLTEYFKVPHQWKEDKSMTTRDEANLLVSILKKHGIKKAYIVTDSWHMPRTMYAFNTAFEGTRIQIIAAPVGCFTSTTKLRFFDFFPSLGALNTSATALHEYIGLLTYFIFNRFLPS